MPSHLGPRTINSLLRAPENKSEEAHDAYGYGEKTCQLVLRGALERQFAIAIVIHGMVLLGGVSTIADGLQGNR